MNGKSNRASGRTDKSRRRAKPLDLNTARRMLPLIQRIVSDIVQDNDELGRFAFEQDGLDRDKRNLNWTERQRRYTVQGEVSRLRSRLDEEQKELTELGAVLLNPALGQVGFPTLVNNQPAFYSWQLGEEGVNFWHFDGESTRRPIPPHWTENSTARLISHR